MSLITPFDPWKNKLCTCPEKYSFSPYTGCIHGCLYCYASSYIRDFTRTREKVNLLKKLEREIKKIPEHSIITIANSCDPYQPLEKKLQLTRKSLLMLSKQKLKISMVTKSPLAIRDMDIFKELNNMILIFTITSLDDKLSKKIEPSVNYTVKEKLKALCIFSKSIPVAARVDPLIYPLNTLNLKKIIKRLKSCGVKQIITSTYKTKPDNFMRMKKIFPQYARLWDELYTIKGERMGGCNYLPFNLRKKLIEEIREISLAEKLKFSSCREGLGFLNTSGCDGSSLFK